MLQPSFFAQTCLSLGFPEVVGVPDSVLKDAARGLEITYGENHRIVANEGSAIAYAIGVYAHSKMPALVYMQNSGLGNALNPLVSLAHRSVMGVPMVLLIGWRGELTQSGCQDLDEPQHLPQGQITCALLDLLKIPWVVIGPDSDCEAVLRASMESAIREGGPSAIIVRRNTFSTLEKQSLNHEPATLSREEVIRVVLESLPHSVPLVAATGMIGREVHENSRLVGRSGEGNLLVVGGMGHCSAIAASIARRSKGGKVLCLDGDGGVLMHMGSLPHAAKEDGLVHIMLNNGVHDSVGGQATVARSLDFQAIAMGSGYSSYSLCETPREVESALFAALGQEESSFIEILCKPGHRSDLGRPDDLPRINFRSFGSFLSQREGGDVE